MALEFTQQLGKSKLLDKYSQTYDFKSFSKFNKQKPYVDKENKPKTNEDKENQLKKHVSLEMHINKTQFYCPSNTLCIPEQIKDYKGFKELHYKLNE